MTFKTLASHSNTVALKRNTPITQAIPGRELDQAPNNGGGFSFKLSNWKKLDRFLIIGTENGTFYSSEQALNAQNLTVIKSLIQEDGLRVVDRCIEISMAGRSRNNDYALLVMAMVLTHGSGVIKRYAAKNLSLVVRTGTHLFHFVGFVTGMRGWGKQLKYAIQRWYFSKTSDQVAYQAIKYQSRDGWSHRDILRLSHPKANESDVIRNNMYKYIVKGKDGMVQGDMVPPLVVAFEQAKTADEKTLIKLILDYRLSHEMIPNEHKGSAKVWEALYQNMGTTAILRNLNKLTAIGLIAPFSSFSKDVASRLNNVNALVKDRIHPLQVFIALKQYSAGKGDRGSLVWTPDNTIVAGLNSSFYNSFQAVTPSGKNLFLALDVSASMNSMASGVPVTCREASAIMAMVTLRVESNAEVFGFDHTFRSLGIQPTDNLEVAMAKTYSRNFGSTNCSLPMAHSLAMGWDVDCFCIYTDNEVNQGRNHPSQALQNYRNRMGKPEAKLITMGMTSNGFSIADPMDAGMLDVVGFDSAAPRFISDFAAGRI